MYALLDKVCDGAGVLLGDRLRSSRSILLLCTWPSSFLVGYWEPSLVLYGLGQYTSLRRYILEAQSLLHFIHFPCRTVFGVVHSRWHILCDASLRHFILVAFVAHSLWSMVDSFRPSPLQHILGGIFCNASLAAYSLRYILGAAHPRGSTSWWYNSHNMFFTAQSFAAHLRWHVI